MINLDTKERTLFSTQKIKQLSEIIGDINDQFEDHLHAINENTNEIEANYELLNSLGSKIDKLNERLEKIELFLHEKADFELEKEQIFEIMPLSAREQQVFLMLYTLEETKGSVTYMDITKRIGLTEDLVANYIKSMVEKGVPILKKYIAGKAHLRLDQRFKRLQAKENILKIEQKTITNLF